MNAALSPALYYTSNRIVIVIASYRIFISCASEKWGTKTKLRSQAGDEDLPGILKKT